MANEANESTKWLYEQLKGKGYNVGKDVNEFDSLMRSNADSRQWAYDTAKKSGLNVGKDIDEFSSLVGGTTSPAPVIDTTPDQTAEVQPSTEKKQEGWKPTPLQKALKMEDIYSGVDSTLGRIRQSEDNTRRLVESRTDKGRDRRKSAEMLAKLAGTPTKVLGLTPDTTTTDGVQDSSHGRPNKNSPVVHGVKYENGVAKTEWMLPDGSLSTSLTDADRAEYGARQARLQYEFVKRMEQNGLDPAKQTDVDKQKRKDLLDSAKKQTDRRLAENEENLHELYSKRGERLDEQGEWNDDESFWSNFVRIVGGAANRSVTANAPKTQTARTPEDSAIGTYLTENQVLTDAKKQLETRKLSKSDGFMGGFWKLGNNWRNMKMGARHALTDADLYAGGVMALQKATRLMDIEDKLKQGVDLTDAEVSLVYSTMLGQNIHENIETPHGYNAAKITVEMFPFMAQMALNPASGLSRAMVTKYGKSGLRKIAIRKSAQGLTGDAAEAFAKKETRKLAAKTVGVQVLGDIAEGAVLANTLQAPKTAADAIERYQGNAVEDNKGNLSFDGSHSWAGAIYKAEASAIIENYTEMLGEHFGIIGNAIGKGVGKGLRFVGGGKVVDAVSDMVGKIGSTEWTKAIGEVEKRAHWNGTVGEVLEEEAGIVLNSIFTGDNKISDLWDADQQIDIVLGVGLFGGFMSGIKSVGYPIGKFRAKGNLRKRDSIGSWRFGDEWEGIRTDIENTDEKDLGTVIRDLVRSHAKSDEQGKAIIEYAHALMNARGYEIASASVRSDGNITPEQQDIEDSFEHGGLLVDGENPQEMNDAKRELERARQKFVNSSSEDFVKDHFDGADAVNNLSNLGTDPELRQEAVDYVNAKAVYDGMIQRVRDDVDGRIAQSDAMIDSRVNRETGMVQPATMKIDDRKVYIVNGTVSMFEDGTGVDAQNSSESIIIRDAETGKVEFADPTQFLSIDEAIDVESEKEVARKQIIDEIAVTAANNIDGVLSFTLGDSYSILDAEGNQQPVTILGNSVDEEGLPVDWSVDIQYPDGTIQSVVTSELQQLVDAASTQRVEQFDQERSMQRDAEAEAARQADQSGLSNPNRRTDLMPDDYKMPYDNRPVGASRYIESENGTGGTLYQDENGNDAIVIAAIDNNNYVGYFREYDEQGNPTNRWSAKFQNGSGLRENHRDMMHTAQELLPAGHELTEHTSVSTDGLRNLANQLKHGYELQYDEQGNVITDRVAVNMMARENDLGLLNYNPGSEELASASYRDEAHRADINARLAQYLAPLGLGEEAITWEDGTLYVDHPILRRADTPQQEVQPTVPQNAETVLNSAENTEIPTENRDLGTKNVPKTEIPVENVQQTADDGFIPIAPEIKPDENGVINIPSPGTAEADAMLAPEESKPTALSQIPTDDKGDPIYEQADPGTAWDALLEETEDEQMAQNVIAQEIAEREDALKKLEKQKPKAGLSTREKIQAEKDKKKALDVMQRSIDHWKAMGETSLRRQQAAEAEQQRIEAERLQEEARIEAERKEREKAEREEVAALKKIDRSYADVHAEVKEYPEAVERLHQQLPEDIFEAAALVLSTNKLLWGDNAGSKGTAAETGFKEGERKGLFSMFASREKGGKSLARLAEDEMKQVCDVHGIPYDNSAARDALIEIISQARIPSDITRFIRRRRIEQARQIAEGEQRRERETFEEWSQENYHMSADDFEAYQENLDNENTIDHENFDFNDFNGNIADELINYNLNQNETLHERGNQGYEPQGESIGFGGGDQVLSPQQSIASQGSPEDAGRPRISQENGDNLLLQDATLVQDPSRTDTAITQSQRPETKDQRQSDLDRGAHEVSTPPLSSKIAEAEAQVNTDPTDRQKEAGNYRKGHVQVGAFDVTIENPKGSKRSGMDADGKKWETTMTHTYGYIRGTTGVDGDHIDVYISSDVDDWNGRKAFVVDQYNPDGSFDEHKVMLGFNDRDDAFSAYLSNYEEGWQNGRRLDVTAVNLEDFEKWIDSSKRKTKPFAEYRSVKAKEDTSGVGRSLSRQEADDMIALMEANAEIAPEIELTIENWDAEFGESGIVNTPIGYVKMGENQFTKLMRQGRNGKLGMVKPTLENPDIIIEDNSVAKDNSVTERPSSYVFVKSFRKADGGRYYHFTSITVSKDGNEVVVSNQEKSRNRVLRLMQEGSVVWRTPKDAATPSTGKQGLDYVQPIKVETAPKGSGLTPQTTPSVGKVNTLPPDKQNDSEESSDLYSIQPKPYTNRQGKTLDTYLVTFLREFSKEEMAALRALAKEKKGWHDRESGGWMLRSREDAKAFANEVIGKTETQLSEEAPLSLSDLQLPSPSSDQQPTTTDHRPSTKDQSSKWVDDEDAEEFARLRSILRNGLGQLNSGFPPELLYAGGKMSYLIMKHGVRKFADYASAMIEELGDAIRPHLKSLYNFTRSTDDVLSSDWADQLTPFDEVLRFDTANFLKDHVDALATAAHVVAEEDSKTHIKEAERKARSQRNKSRQPSSVVNKGKKWDATGEPEKYKSGSKKKKGDSHDVIWINLGNNRRQQIGSTVAERDAIETLIEEFGSVETVWNAYEDGKVFLNPNEAAIVKRIIEKSESKTDNKDAKNASLPGLFDELDNQVVDEIKKETKPEKPKSEKQLAGDSADFQIRSRQECELVEDIIVEIMNRADMKTAGEDKGPLSMRDIKGMLENYNHLSDISTTDMQELVERAMTILTRKTAKAWQADPKKGYDRVVAYYNMQPLLNARDSTRVERQQYSTPTPFGYVMGQFVNSMNNVKSILEPSAGNGALTIMFDPSAVHVNDIDERRLENLRTLGYGVVTNQNALLPFDGEKVDGILTNPPFGTTDVKIYDGIFKISSLEGQMAINALDAMKDNGRAAIVIGGNTEYRENGVMKPKDMAFFGYLYSHYNVVDVINMDGEMYARNGTKYPVRIILINGRKTGKFNRVIPPVKSKGRAEQVKTFDELYNRVQDDISQIYKMGRESSGEDNASAPTTDKGNGKSDGARHNKPDSENGGESLSTGNERSGRGNDSSSVREIGSPTAPGGSIEQQGSNPSSPGMDNGSSRNPGGDNDVQGSQTGRGKQSDDELSYGERGSRDAGRLSAAGGNSTVRERLAVSLTDEKVPYPNQSASGTLMSVVPANQAEPLSSALNKIGDVDQFLVDKLGYSSKEELFKYLAAEQIDSVSLAINQMSQGNGFIIGDMTGVGKGRQGAALIRYGVREGKNPIYFTQKPALFSDNYRDLADIGSGNLRPFIIASDAKNANITDAEGNTVHRLPSKKEFDRVYDYALKNGKLPEEYDYVLITYSQIQNGMYNYEAKGDSGIQPTAKTKTSKADVSGERRRQLLEALSKDNIMILDESHTVGGQGGGAMFMQYIMQNISGVTFLSATFAKRADNMPIYAMKTAMSESGMQQGEMIDAIASGGVTLQEIMSKQLVQSGQMIRRERSFQGVTIDWMSVDEEKDKVQRQQFDEVANIFNAIRAFQDDYIKPLIEQMSDDISVSGSYAGITRGTEAMGVKNTPFASKMYNLVNQLLFALKADAVADRVIWNLKNGFKPVISFTNTMEGFLDEAPKDTPMDEIPNFSITLMKALDGVMRYTVTDVDNNNEGGRISLSQLGEEGEKKYNEIRDRILNLSADLPISPMDAIRMKIESAGYKVGEITGRNLEMVEEDGKYIVRNRKDKDKKAAARDFNSGALDVLMINKSGSTGISLHASSKFADSRQRVMVFAQFQSDINDEVQMRGRIDRTGQVFRGKYEYIVSSIPAEQRLQMMFKAKLKSLDANTTSSQKSKFNEMQVVDYLNKYGDEVTWQYMMEHPELEEKLGDPLKMLSSNKDDDSRRNPLIEKEGGEKDGCAAKIARYLPFLTVAEQEEVFKDITEAYAVKIQLLNDAGENDLEITTMPLKAETKSKKIWKPGTNPDSGNAFADNTYLEEVEVDVLKKPMKAAEVRAYADRLSDGKPYDTWKEGKQSEIESFFNNKIESTREKLQSSALERAEKQREKARQTATRKAEQGKENYSADQIEDIAQAAYREVMDNAQDKINAQIAALEDRLDGLKNTLNRFTPLQPLVIPTDLSNDSGGELLFSNFGTFVGFKFHKDFSLGSSTAIFATLDGRRKVEVPLNNTNALGIIQRKTMFAPHSIKREHDMEHWDGNVPTRTRKKAYIVTGNLLQALVDTQKGVNTKGYLVSYSTIDGEVRQGILMPDRFTPADLRNSEPISSRLHDIMNGNKVESENGEVSIERVLGWRHKGNYELRVPKSTSKGARYFTNKALRNLVVDNEFETRGNSMVAFINDPQLKEALDILSNQLGVTVLNKSKLKDNTQDENIRFRSDDDPESIVSGLDKVPVEIRNMVWNYISSYPSAPISIIDNSKDLEFEDLSLEDKVFLKNFVENDQNGAAFYYSGNGKIYIFANRLSNDVITDILQHENTHAAIDKWRSQKGITVDSFLDQFRDTLVNSKAFGNAFREMELLLSEEYDAEDLSEEFMAYTLGEIFSDNIPLNAIEKLLGTEKYALLKNNLINNLYGKESENQRRISSRTSEENIGDIQKRQGSGRESSGQGRGSGELNRNGYGAYSNADVSIENDPWSKAWGESIRTKRQQKQFAERERERMRERAKSLSSILGLDIEVIEDSSTLKGKKQRAKGWYDTKTGKITVVVSNHNSASDMEATILHEAVAHHGLRQLLGKHFDEFLDKVYEAAEDSIKEHIDLLASRNGWNRRVATEEYLAGLAERTDFDQAEERVGGWFDKIKRLFFDMLFKAGFKHIKPGSIGDNELRYILWRSYQNLANPGRYRAFEWEAEDVAMQYGLKVGTYSEAPADKPADAATNDGIRFRDGDFTPRDRALAALQYERMLSRGSWQFREATQDSMLGLKTLYDSILGSNLRIENVAGYENAYLYENRMSSANNGEQHQYFSRFMKPLLESIHKLCGSKELDRRILTDYMMAKHGLERNEYMRKEAAANGEDTERDFAGLCGLTGEDDWQVAETVARQMVDDYEADHDTAELWDNVKKATNATLEKIYLSGLISEDTYNKVLGMYDFYIPLRGWDETTSDEVYGYLTSKDGPLMGSVFKSAEGRDSKADDPIATIAMMADDAIRQGNRNIMKQRFLNFVHGNPSDLVSVNEMWLQHNDVTDEWEPVFADLQPDMTHAEVESEIAKFEAKMEALRTAEPDKYKKGRDARNIPYKVVRGNLNEHQVLVKRNGRTYVMTINGNPRAAQALNGLTNPNVEVGGVIGDLLKLGEYVNRHLSAFYTTRNPDFVVSNFLRDMLYSNCMTWVKENPRYALRFHKNFGKVNPLTLRRLLSKWENDNLSDSNYLEKMFKEFMLNGGETGYTSVKDIEGHKRTIASELKKQGSTGRKAWNALGMQLDLLNRSAENCARFAAFLTSREMGRTLDRSIYDAKEVSVNFNKKGSGGKFVNATGQKFLGKLGSYLGGGGRIAYVFWNAGIQGMTNFGRAGKRNPGKAIGGVATLFTLGYVIPLLAQMLGGGDGDYDDKNAYYNLPEYVRRSNICFKAGEQWITIPLPIEYRAIYGMGELACGVISGNERYSNSELTRQMASQVSQVMPLDMLEGGGGISPFIPSAFKPMTEAYILNKGWTGLPVYKDTPYNKNDPEWTKAYQSADQHLVAFTRWLNETSGGNDYKKGAIDINPAKLEYLLSGTFGGAVSTTGKLKKMGETALGEREFEWRNMLLANRVIKSGDERTANRKLQNEYFKYLNEYEETNRLRKKYENAADDGILGYAERADFLYNSPEYLRFEIFEEYKPDIDAIREEIKGETDSKAKKELQNELFATMRELVDELHEAEEKSE